MPRLLVEDLANSLGKDPSKLKASEFRIYLILIDWALALETNWHQTPYLAKVDIDQEKINKIKVVLVTAIAGEQFKKLEGKPDLNDMDDMFIELATAFGVKERAELMVNEGSTASMADYELKIAKGAYIHSDTLTYVPELPKANPKVKAATAQLLALYNQLKELKVFTANREEFIEYNKEKKALDIIKIDQLNPSTKKITNKDATQLVLFYLTLMSTFKTYNELSTIKIAEGVFKDIYKHINPLIQLLKSNDIEMVQIARLMRDLMPNDSKNIMKTKLGKGLSQLIMNNQTLRGSPYTQAGFFKIFAEIHKDKPIDRVILIGPEDLANEEVIKTINMILTKHSNENIVITFDKDEIPKIDQHNKMLDKSFTLNVVGHGSLKGEKELNANLGPFRGIASKTGMELATLVNLCTNINHLRITGCFTGLIKKDADLKKYEEFKEKPRTEFINELRTFTMKTSGELNEINSPFVDTTVAVNCWNNINKENREISMTVSPGLIEPDEEIKHMAWPRAKNADKSDTWIKEICITTPEGPKKHRLTK